MIRYFAFAVWMGILSTQDASVHAQADTISSLKFSGGLEIFYRMDPGGTKSPNQTPFLFSFNRIGETNLNLGFFRADLSRRQWRSHLALAAGTYMAANYSQEPPGFRNMLEANLGIRLSRNRSLWLDAGILPSHIGLESAVGSDNWALSRSLMAENSPYFESGIRLSATSSNEKWYGALLLLNGWQRIHRPDGNTTPAFGHQLTWKPRDGLTLNSSSFAGNDFPDSLRRMRYFHNLYVDVRLHAKWSLQASFDSGWQQRSKGNQEMDNWYAALLMLRYRPSENLSFTSRAEYYHDPKQVIINATGLPFASSAFSLNADVFLLENLLWRMEARWFHSDHGIFKNKRSDPVHDHLLLVSSLSCRFGN